MPVFRRVIEPARPYGDVDLGWPPHRAGTIAVLQRVVDARSILSWKRHDGRVHGGPVRIARSTVFVSAPAHVRAGVGKHDRIGLESSHQTKEAWPVVNLALTVWPFAISAVEPHFGDRTVSRQ